MSTVAINNMGTIMRANLSSFLSRHIDDQQLAWPRLKVRNPARATTWNPTTDCQGMKVLVIGDLALRVDLAFDGSEMELVERLKHDPRTLRIRLEPNNFGLGGFVGRVVPVAAALGAEICVWTRLPEPMPNMSKDFLERYHVHEHHFVQSPDAYSLEIRFRCSDGTTSIVHAQSPGTIRVEDHSVKYNADVILLEASACCRPASCLARQMATKCTSARQPIVGQRLTHDRFRESILLWEQSRVWSFLSESEALALNPSGNGEVHANANIDGLQQSLTQLPSVRVVVHLGGRGAVLLKRASCPYFVHTCTVDSEGSYGAGDVLLTVTTLSAAAGAGDRTSLRRGVTAASGSVAGLPLPVRLEELDVDQLECEPLRVDSW